MYVDSSTPLVRDNGECACRTHPLAGHFRSHESKAPRSGARRTVCQAVMSTTGGLAREPRVVARIRSGSDRRLSCRPVIHDGMVRSRPPSACTLGLAFTQIRLPGEDRPARCQVAAYGERQELAYSVEKLDRATWPASAQLQNAGGARHTDGFQGYAEAHGRDLHRGSSRGTQTYSPIAHRLELLWWRRDIRVFQQNRPGLRVRGRPRQRSFDADAWLPSGSCRRAWGADGPGPEAARRARPEGRLSLQVGSQGRVRPLPG
jgi:hypothetical protein